MNRKALVLISGGLDSSLAIGLMQRQNVALEGVSFFSFFSDGMRDGRLGQCVRITQNHFNIAVHYKFLKQEFIDMVRTPVHGYGVKLNPCIDCKILMLRTAKQLMATCGASFVVTGEVLGERPMSQHKRSLETIERAAGLEGLIVRPLSGALLPPTEPERAGILDRTKFLAIQGRSRKAQIELARELGLREYPTPAGGCVLTQTPFAARMQDLFAYGYSGMKRFLELRWGRHFRLSPSAKVIIGRNKRENDILFALAEKDDCILELAHMKGPLAILAGTLSAPILEQAAALVKYYSKAKSSPHADVKYWRKGDKQEKVITASMIDSVEIDRLAIGS